VSSCGSPKLYGGIRNVRKIEILHGRFAKFICGAQRN
jgi:hypothetical protein